MGQISLQTPQVGQPNFTEDPKIANDFTTIQNVINGNIDDSNLASPNSGYRKMLLQATGYIASGSGATGGDYVISQTGGCVSSGLTFGNGIPAWAQDSGLSGQPPDFQVPNKTAYARVRSTILVNSFAPGVTFTFGLYLLTGVSGTETMGFTFGSAIPGTTVAVPNPNASFGYAVESAQFALPQSGNACVLGFNINGAMASNSGVSITMHLLGYNA